MDRERVKLVSCHYFSKIRSSVIRIPETVNKLISTFDHTTNNAEIVKEDRPQVGVAEHVVISLMEPYHKTGQNVTTDNYFTSLRTAKNLLQHNITMAGILRKNKKKIPAELHVDTRQQPLYTLRFLFTQENSIILLYYKVKKKKDVFLLLSMNTTPIVDD